MNTRIQVEHTVTEMATGIDLVREQVLIAAGEPLSLAQEDVRLSGHAIECRINAEDAATGFLPSPGRITRYREPAGPGVRVDSGVAGGLRDPCALRPDGRQADRARARSRAGSARACCARCVSTSSSGRPRWCHSTCALLEHPCFVAGDTCRGVVDGPELAERASQLAHELADQKTHDSTVAASADGAQGASATATPVRSTVVEVEGRRLTVRRAEPAPPWTALAERRRERASAGPRSGAAAEDVVSPMQGTVLAVEVADGDEVSSGDILCIVEAMKMENEVRAHRAGVVRALSVSAGVGRRERPGHLPCGGHVTPEELVRDLVARDALTAATLSRPRKGPRPGYARATVRPVETRRGRRYAWVAHYPNRTATETLPRDEVGRRLTEALRDDFRQGLLHTPEADYQVLGGEKVLRRPPTRPRATLDHDRRKRRVLPDGEPVPFLVELGVMTADGKVRASRQDKFRQVNRFLEVVEDTLDALPASGTLRVVDYGSGRSYLTFALHHLLRERHGRDVSSPRARPQGGRGRGVQRARRAAGGRRPTLRGGRDRSPRRRTRRRISS